ncbi:cupin domain-containing protein [uncultured Sunxiuqinia sp.]|uniref:cupin domain-containing protein n=1 Tax=uncultured Sunxiuqinia sp. TaxID=1573825 RepID=UPI0030DA7DD5|tara:strand:- start:11723 stop:12235 length:513 start_codon:yes stop_codon:yes gene_type:complete
MATILKRDKRDFKEDPNKIDNFRLFSDISRVKMGIRPQNLNFDLRLINPGQFSAPYHFHRHAEELFMVVSGTMTLRTPEGLEIVNRGDIIFFEMGVTGAHQFYNHGSEPCVYLDVRTFIGYDVCEYPDSGKLLLAPSYEIFHKGSELKLFDGEENVVKKWHQIENGNEAE